MIKEFKTRTGAIFSDTEHMMEYLYVGDYGKENNIKADFLGLTKEINGVEHHDVDLDYKLVVTISTQKGCPMNCMFCDCPKVGFHGNLTRDEMAEEIVRAIKASGAKHTKRFNLHLARMGEPMFNYKNVDALLTVLPYLIEGTGLRADVIHPVLTTMLPKSIAREKLLDMLWDYCSYIKNYDYKGEAGLQFSINSTNSCSTLTSLTIAQKD